MARMVQDWKMLFQLWASTMIPKAGKVLTPAQYGAVAPPGDKWPLNVADRAMYGINKIYGTIQGEGGQAGTPMTIVRLQGCPVECRFCDTPESWAVPAETGWRHTEQIVRTVRGHSPMWALVTGGEPTWYDLQALTSALHKAGIETALETSGVYDITGDWDYITISPKPDGVLPLQMQNVKLANEIKWIVGRDKDIRFIEGRYEAFLQAGLLVDRRPRWSIQPMSTNKKATEICFVALMDHPNWRLSVQTHKYLDIA